MHETTFIYPILFQMLTAHQFAFWICFIANSNNVFKAFYKFNRELFVCFHCHYKGDSMQYTCLIFALAILICNWLIFHILCKENILTQG